MYTYWKITQEGPVRTCSNSLSVHLVGAAVAPTYHGPERSGAGASAPAWRGPCSVKPSLENPEPTSVLPEATEMPSSTPTTAFLEKNQRLPLMVRLFSWLLKALEFVIPQSSFTVMETQVCVQKSGRKR